jgi:hypothetical protein
MIGVAFGCVLNLRYGVRPRHYGVALISALVGAAVSIRQTLLHIVPGSPSFGTPVLGLGLWVWAFIVFTVAALGIAAMLLLEDPTTEPPGPTKTTTVTTAFGLLFVIAVANVILSLRICGLGPCTG